MGLWNWNSWRFPLKKKKSRFPYKENHSMRCMCLFKQQDFVSPSNILTIVSKLLRFLHHFLYSKFLIQYKPIFYWFHKVRYFIFNINFTKILRAILLMKHKSNFFALFWNNFLIKKLTISFLFWNQFTSKRNLVEKLCCKGLESFTRGSKMKWNHDSHGHNCFKHNNWTVLLPAFD